MTNAEIDQMIAEKVMGWKFKTIDENTPLRFCLEDGGYILDGKVFRFTIGYSTIEFNPSTNITDIFKAVDKILADDKDVQFDLHGTHKDYSAIFFKSGLGMEILGAGDADTPAMAICMAALEAVKAPA